MVLEVTLHLKDARWKSALRPYCKSVRETLAAALEDTPFAKVAAPWQVAVVLADDAFIKTLNHDYRSKDKATNVLSFPAGEGTAAARNRAHEHELGDIILAFETITREANEQQKPFRHHARHLLVHGLLHLLGHDHMDEKEAAKMEALEVKILKKQGIANPYL